MKLEEIQLTSRIIAQPGIYLGSEFIEQTLLTELLYVEDGYGNGVLTIYEPQRLALHVAGLIRRDITGGWCRTDKLRDLCERLGIT